MTPQMKELLLAARLSLATLQDLLDHLRRFHKDELGGKYDLRLKVAVDELDYAVKALWRRQELN